MCQLMSQIFQSPDTRSAFPLSQINQSSSLPFFQLGSPFSQLACLSIVFIVVRRLLLPSFSLLCLLTPVLVWYLAVMLFLRSPSALLSRCYISRCCVYVSHCWDCDCYCCIGGCYCGCVVAIVVLADAAILVMMFDALILTGTISRN